MAGDKIRILGIDPGLRITGFGVIDKIGSNLTYVSSGSVKTFEGELPSRLKLILDNLSEVITQYKPEHAAIEQVFVNINPQSTLLLGQARGAAICAAVMNDLIVAEYTALQIKQAVVGNGHAKKIKCKKWLRGYLIWQAVQVLMRQMHWLVRYVMPMVEWGWERLRQRATA